MAESSPSGNKTFCLTCNDLLSLPDASPPAKRMKCDESSDVPNEVSSVCQHCMNLLNSDFQQTVVDKVADRLAEEKYVGLTSFQLCIQISPSIFMQHVAARIYLNQAATPVAEPVADEATPSSSVVPYSDSFRKGIKDNIKMTFIDAFIARLGLKARVESLFQITIELKHTATENACEKLLALKKKTKKRRKDPVTFANVLKAMEESSYEELQQLELLPNQTDYPECLVSVNLVHDPIFVAGRYNKYSRKLSQTPWIIDGVRRMESSVQDMICDHLVNKIRYDSVKFSSSGREDVDVRMLGSGRPFLLELVNPRVLDLSSSDYESIEEQINSSTSDIFVRGLCKVASTSSKILKDGEENKRKTYSALIYCRQPVTKERIESLNDICNLKIAQKTPIRVLHRRSLAVRERSIYSMKTTLIDPSHFKLDLVTEAGTYIKEFVHSDFGRTSPSLCSILNSDIDIKALDVTDLKLDWPPCSK